MCLVAGLGAVIADWIVEFCELRWQQKRRARLERLGPDSASASIPLCEIESAVLSPRRSGVGVGRLFPRSLDLAAVLRDRARPC